MMERRRLRYTVMHGKSVKESHQKDLEKLAADRRREAEETKKTQDLGNTPKHTLLFMT